MRPCGDWKSRALPLLAAFLAVLLAAAALSEMLLPAAGKKTKSKDGLTLDISHADQGYVMAKAAKSKKRLKLRVKVEDHTLNYDLNTEGEYEVFPLQYGDGKYTFTLYKNVSGKKYAEEGKISLTVSLADPNLPFLYPNQYVNYNADTLCVQEAEKICGGMADQRQIYETVCDYVSTHFAYDYIKSVSVKTGTMPDLDGAWEKHMGICQDLSAITVAMLRSQGVPAKMEIGNLNGTVYHAWVTAVVNGEDEFFDPTAAINAVNKDAMYTLERYY
ncbi:MAG: transglutaminase family protein [Clostridia bacterium]|nr:transglutaminase family protein [Clostridia bacterium]